MEKLTDSLIIKSLNKKLEKAKKFTKKLNSDYKVDLQKYKTKINRLEKDIIWLKKAKEEEVIKTRTSTAYINLKEYSDFLENKLANYLSTKEIYEIIEMKRQLGVEL